MSPCYTPNAQATERGLRQFSFRATLSSLQGKEPMRKARHSCPPHAAPSLGSHSPMGLSEHVLSFREHSLGSRVHTHLVPFPTTARFVVVVAVGFLFWFFPKKQKQRSNENKPGRETRGIILSNMCPPLTALAIMGGREAVQTAV